jgi:hypothetical protein
MEPVTSCDSGLFYFNNMPDIIKCNDHDCPYKNGCYRYTTKAHERQSWFAKSPREGDKCDMYWGDASNEIMNQLTKILSGERNE